MHSGSVTHQNISKYFLTQATFCCLPGSEDHKKEELVIRHQLMPLLQIEWSSTQVQVDQSRQSEHKNPAPSAGKLNAYERA